MIREKVSQYFSRMQPNLFPNFGEELGVTTNKHFEVIAALVDIPLFAASQGQSKGIYSGGGKDCYGKLPDVT